VPRDLQHPQGQGKQVRRLYFPWQNSKFGGITIEDIIKQIRKDETVREWKQTVTGYRMAFIRHPEYEFWTNNSTHFKAAPPAPTAHALHHRRRAQGFGPPRDEPGAGRHEGLQAVPRREPRVAAGAVFSIQDRTVSIMIRAGYQTALVAKLLETTHKAQRKARSSISSSTTRPRNSMKRRSTGSFSSAQKTR